MKNFPLIRLALVSSLLLVSASPCTAADDVSVPRFADDTLTGDWSGKRTSWFNSGLSIESTYKLDQLRRVSGGRFVDSGSMSNLDIKLRADLERLWGWQGATAYMHVLDNHGSGFNANNVGSLMGISNIEVPVPTTRIFHAWVQTSFMEEQWLLLAGLYPIDSEFSVLDSAAVMLHPAYGASADLALTRGPSIFNNSAVGIRLKLQAADRTLYAMGAVLDGIPGDPNQSKGTHIRFASGDGSFAIAEIGWTPIELGHTFEPAGPARMLPTAELKAHEKYEGFSKYAVGLWRYSSRVSDQFTIGTLGVPEQRTSSGGYLLAERTLLGLGTESGRHLTGFARYAFTDGHSTPIKSQLNLGFSIRGPLASRTDDILALAWTEARLASKYRAVQWRDNALTTSRDETAIELTYRAAFTPWLSVQPNLQWVRHPGGSADGQTVRIAGFRLEIQL
jgi:porin